ncbi:MAG: putative glycoside hydrolase [Clostridiaceae bacterium]
MKKKIVIPLIILISGLVVAAYATQTGKVQAGKAQASTEENTIIDETNKESGNEAAEKQAQLIKEREELEKQRKEQLGEFYVPLPALGQEPKISTVKAKGIYLTANVAGFSFNEDNVNYYAEYIRSISGQSGKAADTSRLGDINKLEQALAICESSEVNSLVIDIKNDDGLVAWNSDIPIVNRVKSNWTSPLANYNKLIAYLKKKEIYCIARIVAFKDPYFAKMESEHSIQLKSGGVYKDKAGNSWVNPFDEYVWKYLVAISEEAALRGFDEIQFDYVRFPDNAAYYNQITEFPGRNNRDKDEGIEDFLKYATKELKPYNVHMSADVFGIITHSWDDKPEDIGQTWRKVANNTEYICPMIYPSHYGTGLYGYQVPDQHPYEIARLAVLEALEQNAAERNSAKIRPWFQGFTAPWVKGHIYYDAKIISDQLVASRELGIDEYIIWNASCNYDPMTFFYESRINESIRNSGEDILLRTPEAALQKYLEAEKKKRYNYLYLLTVISEREGDYDQYVSEMEKSQEVLKNYEILNVVKNEDGTSTATIKGTYNSPTGTSETKEVKYNIIMENDVYKVSE